VHRVHARLCYRAKGAVRNTYVTRGRQYGQHGTRMRTATEWVTDYSVLSSSLAQLEPITRALGSRMYSFRSLHFRPIEIVVRTPIRVRKCRPAMLTRLLRRHEIQHL